MIKAILTGDIVHSTQMELGHRNWLFEQIDDALKLWSKDYGIASEIFRGDSFQTLVPNPADALLIALLQKSFIRSLNPSRDYILHRKGRQAKLRQMALPLWIFDARVAIGIGEVDSLNHRLASSGGRAFQLSGRLLDSIKNKKQFLAIGTDDDFNDELQTASILLDAIIGKTTALQCEVITLKLLGYTETEIAKKLDIRQSAVNQRSNSANWNAIDAMLKRFKKIYTHD